MATSNPTASSRTISNRFQASRLFQELYWATDEVNPELMEFFPEISDDSRLAVALTDAAQTAESRGFDSDAFLAMASIVRAFPEADYSA